MMAAAILADEPVTLTRVPQLADVHTLARVLESLGMAILRSDGTLRIETADPRPVRRLAAGAAAAGKLLRAGTAAGPTGPGHRPPARRLSGSATGRSISI